MNRDDDTNPVRRQRGKSSRCAFYFRCIGHDDSDTLTTVLRTLGKAAMSAEQRIIDAQRSDDGEYIAEVHAEENMVIEDLLGCAFVAGQSYITHVVSRIQWLHKRLEHDGHCLTTTKGTRSALLKAHSAAILGTCLTHVEVINAFANYYKHREQWAAKWDEESRKDSRETIRIIRLLGATEDLPDNFRKGLVGLGIDRVFDVYAMADILVRWHTDLADAYRKELRLLEQSCRNPGQPQCRRADD